MNRKIMLLALGAVTAMMLAVPAMASAELEKYSLHLNPTPTGEKTITGGAATLSTHNGNTVTCDKVSGGATFTSGGTTGSMKLTFGPNCTTNAGGTCTNNGQASSVTTEALQFHLVTVVHRGANPHSEPGSPGVLVTPPTGKHFATFTCHNVFGFLTLDKTVKGNGVIGTITAPDCGKAATSATISFTQSAAGTQTIDTVRGTTITYALSSDEEPAAQVATGTINMGTNTELVCT